METGFKGDITPKEVRDFQLIASDPAEKKKEYVGKVGSSTKHKVGTIEVECVYGDMQLTKMLADMICE